jgi:hypothetical protein
MGKLYFLLVPLNGALQLTIEVYRSRPTLPECDTTLNFIYPKRNGSATLGKGESSRRLGATIWFLAEQKL